MNQEFEQNQQPTIPVEQPAPQPVVEQTAPMEQPAPVEQPAPQPVVEQPAPMVQPAPQPVVEQPPVPPMGQVPPQSAPVPSGWENVPYGYVPPPPAPTPPAGYPLQYQSFSPYAQTPPQGAGTSPEQPQKKKSKGLRVFLSILLAVVIFIAGVSGGYLVRNANPQDGLFGSWFGDDQQQPQANQGPVVGQPSTFDITVEEPDGTAYSYEQIVAKVSPSIVNITVYSPDGKSGSYASGIIMDAAQGYVLTNDHIYGEVPGAKFLITLNDQTEFKATFVSGDSRSDIAILKIENPQNLVAASFSVSQVNVGAKVLAIGQSYGYADTVTEGIVSAVNRRVTFSSGSYSEQYIQTTAAINPGNSGGALVNMSGQVIGITTAKIASQEVEGLGFAIPSQKALDIVKNLQENGYVKGRARLGITYAEITAVTAEVEGLPVGIYVQSVDSTFDVAAKGVVQGDVITHVNGTPIQNANVMLDIIDTSKAGDTVTITVYKTATNSSVDLQVVLGESESSNSYTLIDPNNNPNQLPTLPY